MKIQTRACVKDASGLPVIVSLLFFYFFRKSFVFNRIQMFAQKVSTISVDVYFFRACLNEKGAHAVSFFETSSSRSFYSH